MKAYIIAIICISVVGSIVSILAPEGDGGGLGKHIRLIFGLCLIVVCLGPIKKGIEVLSSLDVEDILPDVSQDSEEYESIFDSAYGAAEVENLKEGIKKILLDRFGIDGSECSVSVSLDGHGDDGEPRKLSRVLITLHGSAVFRDSGEIEDYFSTLLGCEIVTAVGKP